MNYKELKEGLYLFFPDGKRVDLSRDRLNKESLRLEEELKSNPDKDYVDMVYRRCDVCPKKAVRGFCVQPFLPVIAELGGYDSYAPVRAMYKPPGSDYVIVADTTLQEALKYVTILSFTDYCETGLLYKELFHGVNPLTSTMEIVRTVHRELYWNLAGDESKMKDKIAEMRTVMAGIAPNLMVKIRRMIPNDALANSVHKIHIISEFLETLYEQHPPGRGRT
jgi:hypothetical protein